jgi:hypothetical protein
MKKRKKNSHISNRVLYTLISLGILMIIGVGVYAATYTASGAGHPYTEISTCGVNQILKMNSAGTGWTCAEGVTETDPNIYNWARQPNQPIIQTGLYGYCIARSSAPGTCNANSPAFCTSLICQCETGYTLKEIGADSAISAHFYSCYKYKV